jgi:uncharacterized membrane protein
MKEENKKYWIGAALVIVILAWYFWEKIEALIEKAKATKVAASGSSSGAASKVAAVAPAASSQQKDVKFYPYGSGIFVEDSLSSNFTPKTGTQSAFK